MFCCCYGFAIDGVFENEIRNYVKHSIILSSRDDLQQSVTPYVHQKNMIELRDLVESVDFIVLVDPGVGRAYTRDQHESTTAV